MVYRVGSFDFTPPHVTVAVFVKAENVLDGYEGGTSENVTAHSQCCVYR
jgi:hypothetical protein